MTFLSACTLLLTAEQQTYMYMYMYNVHVCVCVCVYADHL